MADNYHYEDDRTSEERETHTFLYGGVDTFLSKWGPPADAGVNSRAYWASRREDCDRGRAWVQARSDIPNPEELGMSARASRDFCHVYVVRDGHPALAGGS